MIPEVTSSNLVGPTRRSPRWAPERNDLWMKRVRLAPDAL